MNARQNRNAVSAMTRKLLNAAGMMVLAVAVCLAAQAQVPRTGDNSASRGKVSPNEVSRSSGEVLEQRAEPRAEAQPRPRRSFLAMLLDWLSWQRTGRGLFGPDMRAFSKMNEWRSVDAFGNNEIQPGWGQAGRAFLRIAAPAYADDFGEPSGESRPNPRFISNSVVAQDALKPNAIVFSDYVWQWGQFLDHDINLTPTIDPAEPFDIPVPAGDSFFDPQATGTAAIEMNRSLYEEVQGVRQQLNLITSYIDASNVYGSEEELAEGLRTHDGTGRIKTSGGNLLPLSLEGDPNVPAGDEAMFIAGDERANEQVGLTAMHTLFVREHNYWAGRIREESPGLDGDLIYQRARAMVAAEMQWITYNEFLPVLLGPDALEPYEGYDPGVNASISNVFATAAYRVGHSMLSPRILRLDRRLAPIEEGALPLRDAFFSPAQVRDIGIEPYLRGLAWQTAQEIDCFIVDDLRNFLFGPPGAGGFDLASLNLQRGRDHGLPDYNSVRAAFGLTPVSSVDQISSDPEVQTRLQQAYGTVEDMDLWIAGLAEDHVPGAIVGETFHAILSEQFEALRDGDRFWYQHYMPPELQREVERQSLATIIRRNTTIRREIPDDVFHVRRFGFYAWLRARAQQTEKDH